MVFIDGTICDRTAQLALQGTDRFYEKEIILQAKAVSGSVACMKELGSIYNLVYMGARPPACLEATREWLINNGFPDGSVYLGLTQQDRLSLIETMKEKSTIVAGIGDRWDDNELHLEIGCFSIILKEHDGNWETVRKHLIRSQSFKQ